MEVTTAPGELRIHPLQLMKRGQSLMNVQISSPKPYHQPSKSFAEYVKEIPPKNGTLNLVCLDGLKNFVLLQGSNCSTVDILDLLQTVPSVCLDLPPR